MKQFIYSLIVAAVLTTASYAVGLHFEWIKEVSWLEALSVFASYSCTYLCVMQSRINYLVGTVAVIALCALFYTQSLYSSMALQAYLIFAMLYGWFRWGKDDKTLPVSRLKLDWWLAGYAAITGFTFASCVALTTWLGGTIPLADSAILVFSILAQFLMDNKKLEAWAVWIVVNVISVMLYWTTDLKILAIQMGLFLLNALWGFYLWHKSMENKSESRTYPDFDDSFATDYRAQAPY